MSSANTTANPAIVVGKSPTENIADNAMDVMEELPEEEDKKDHPTQKINRDELPGLVSDRVNPCVTKAVDYTLLVGLLILQFLRCSPPSPEDLVNGVNDGTIDQSSLTSVYSCDLSDSQSSLFYGGNVFMNVFVIISIAICALFGAIASVGVYIHGWLKVKDLEMLPRIEKTYSVTEKILLLDTFCEIPIAFYWTPVATVLLWGSFTIAFIGLIMLNTLFARTAAGDVNAQSVFSTSTFLVGFSLFKLTGEVSRYWVIYRASAFPNENPPDGIEEDADGKKRGVDDDEKEDGGAMMEKLEEVNPEEVDQEEVIGNMEGLTEKGSTEDEIMDDVDETKERKEEAESKKWFGLF